MVQVECATMPFTKISPSIIVCQFTYLTQWLWFLSIGEWRLGFEWEAASTTTTGLLSSRSPIVPVVLVVSIVSQLTRVMQFYNIKFSKPKVWLESVCKVTCGFEPEAVVSENVVSNKSQKSQNRHWPLSTSCDLKSIRCFLIQFIYEEADDKSEWSWIDDLMRALYVIHHPGLLYMHE